MKKIILLLLILTIIAVPVLAQVPDIGQAGCVAGYDRWGNVVPCGYGDEELDYLPWIIGFCALCAFLAITLPRSKTPPIPVVPQPVQPVLNIKKVGHIIKQQKVSGKGSYNWEGTNTRPSHIWGYLSLVIGIVSIPSIWYEAGHYVGPVAVLFYFIQQRSHTSWQSLVGLVLGYGAFSYQVLDYFAWTWGYYIMYLYLAVFLFGLYVIYASRNRTVPIKAKKKKKTKA